MKAMLEFDLDDSDEQEQHRITLAANDLLWAIQDLDRDLRGIVKYGTMPALLTGERIPDDHHATVGRVRELLWAILRDRGIAALVG